MSIDVDCRGISGVGGLQKGEGMAYNSIMG